MTVVAIIAGGVLLVAAIAIGGVLLVRSGFNPYVQDRAHISAAVRAIPSLVAANQNAQRSIRRLRREIREELRDSQAAVIAYVDKGQRSLVGELQELRATLGTMRAEQAEFRGFMAARAEQIDKELTALFTAYGATKVRDSA